MLLVVEDKYTCLSKLGFMKAALFEKLECCHCAASLKMLAIESSMIIAVNGLT